MQIDSKIINEIYPYICDSLEVIIADSNFDIVKIRKLIKERTILYLIETGQIYFLESFNDVISTFKTIFWSSTLNLWTGNISMGNWMAGVGLNAIFNKGLSIGSFGSTLFSEVLKKLGLTTISTAGSATANIFLLRALNIAIFPSVLLGLIIYRLIKYNDILAIKNLEDVILSISLRLQISNKKDYKPMFKQLNTKYTSILKNDCANIEESESRLKCASNYYVKYITEIILKVIIEEYILFIKKNNLNVKVITSFFDLCHYEFTDSAKVKLFKMLYIYYNNVLNVYVFERVYRERYISLLNKYVLDSINNLEK